MNRDGRTSPGAGHWVLLSLAVLAPFLALGARLLEPDPRGVGTHEQLGLAPCALRGALGLPCPACGVTTSVALAARGDLGAALATQPFGLLLVVLLPLAAVLALVAHARGKDLAETVVAGRWARPVVGALAVAIVAAWLYKIRSMSG